MERAAQRLRVGERVDPVLPQQPLEEHVPARHLAHGAPDPPRHRGAVEDPRGDPLGPRRLQQPRAPARVEDHRLDADPFPDDRRDQVPDVVEPAKPARPGRRDGEADPDHPASSPAKSFSDEVLAPRRHVHEREVAQQRQLLGAAAQERERAVRAARLAEPARDEGRGRGQRLQRPEQVGAHEEGVVPGAVAADQPVPLALGEGGEGRQRRAIVEVGEVGRAPGEVGLVGDRQRLLGPEERVVLDDQDGRAHRLDRL